MIRLGIAEILERADYAGTIEEKTAILHKHATPQLLEIIRVALDPTIKFLLPEGTIEYKPNPLVDCQNQLYMETRKLYLFIEGALNAPPGLTNKKRLQLFTNLLCNLDPQDAELMMHVKDKRLPYYTLTREVIDEIFPGLISKENTN